MKYAMKLKLSLIASLCLMLIVTGCQFKKVYEQQEVSLLPPDAYLQMLEQSEAYYLIDVRTRREYKKAHIYGAENIPFPSSKFREAIDGLDPSKPVFIYCETAHRSPFAAKELRKAGFTRIYDLKRGFNFWRKKGYQFKGNKAVGQPGQPRPEGAQGGGR